MLHAHQHLEVECSVDELRTVLATVPADARLVANRVGNLAVYRAAPLRRRGARKFLGYIDFVTETYEFVDHED